MCNKNQSSSPSPFSQSRRRRARVPQSLSSALEEGFRVRAIGKVVHLVQKQKSADRRLDPCLDLLSLLLLTRSGCDPGFYDRFLG